MATRARKGRHPSSSRPDEVDPDQRKERVLHTRVPESLDRHLKNRARGLGLSVSTVVRNVLLNTFGLVEDIVNDSTNIALALSGEEPAPGGGRRGRNVVGDEAPATGGVVAWQEVVLNVNAVCEQCNDVLHKGSSGRGRARSSARAAWMGLLPRRARPNEGEGGPLHEAPPNPDSRS
jgi:hypothetical protein